MRGWAGCAAVVVAIGAVGCARNLAPPRQIDLVYEGPIQSRDIVEGGRIYMTLCAACHRGRVNPRGYSWSPGQMRHQIREGNRLMPPLSDELLSDEQVEAVLAYLSVMGALEGELPPRRPGELDLDEEVADREIDAEEAELVGATASPELPAAGEPTAEAQPTAEAEVAREAEPAPDATPPEPEPPAPAGPEEGASGLAPPSGPGRSTADRPDGAPSDGSDAPPTADADAPSPDAPTDGPAGEDSLPN